MAADVEQLVTQLRDLHAAFDSGEWEPSRAEHACAVRILEAVATHPLDEAIVHGLRPVTPVLALLRCPALSAFGDAPSLRHPSSITTGRRLGALVR